MPPVRYHWGMTEARRKNVRAALQRLRGEAVAAGPAKIEPNRTDEAAVGVPDEDAQALSEMMQSVASQRNKQMAERIAHIDAALRRLLTAPDEFGHCEECEEEIDARRLGAMPWATLCTECQAKRDPRRNQGRRKVTDYR
jgi:DnaK suppressor protein